MMEEKYQSMLNDYYSGDLCDIDMPEFINLLLEHEGRGIKHYYEGRKIGFFYGLLLSSIVFIVLLYIIFIFVVYVK